MLLHLNHPSKITPAMAHMAAPLHLPTAIIRQFTNKARTLAKKGCHFLCQSSLLRVRHLDVGRLDVQGAKGFFVLVEDFAFI
jgi:hypothetical protein